jgi:hypothetical protein
MKKIKILIAIVAMLIVSATTYAQVSAEVTASIAPPPLVVYSQPPCPEDGYIWTPGYWAYDAIDGYYWVPGVWVSPPESDYYWTPCYWGFNNGIYGFYAGYWGPSIGFYGGVDYGYGYGGFGYDGGRWEGGHFRYNTAVTNVNRGQVHNTYVDRSVANTRQMRTRTSFNGPGGITRGPRPEERAAMNQPHTSFTHEQEAHQQSASKNRNQLASVNHGRPAVASMNKVGGKPFNGQVHSAVARSHAASTGSHPHTTRVAPQHASTPHAQTHMQSHPQQHMTHPQTQMRAAPQQHIQSHPQPQMHSAPQAAPHMESYPAGGGMEHGGGGEGGGEHRR